MPTSSAPLYASQAMVSIGLNWRKGDTFEVSVEGFYKDYDKIPLSVADGIPLTCKGNDYGVIGNELLTSTAQGRSYGAELLLKWLVAKKLISPHLSRSLKANIVLIRKANTSLPHGTTALFSTCGELTTSPSTGASE